MAPKSPVKIYPQWRRKSRDWALIICLLLFVGVFPLGYLLSGNNLNPAAVAAILPAIPLFLWSIVTNRLAGRLLNPVEFILSAREVRVGEILTVAATFEPNHSGRIRRMEAVLRAWQKTSRGDELVAELRSGENEIYMSAGEDLPLEFALAVPDHALRTEKSGASPVRWSLTCAADFPLAGRWEWDDEERVTVYF